MKHIMWTVGAASVFMGSLAFAAANTPGVDQRLANQERRIDQGIATGELNQREANRLNKQQDHINNMEDKAKSDGVVTKKERARLGAAQNRASRHIAKQKNDRQHN